MISRFLFWILTHFVFIVGKSFPGETICHLLLQMAAILARFDKKHRDLFLEDITQQLIYHTESLAQSYENNS